jgi:hypothetical protein
MDIGGYTHIECPPPKEPPLSARSTIASTSLNNN